MPANIGVLTSIDFGGAANSLGRQFKNSFEAGYQRIAGHAPTYPGNSPQDAKGKYSADGRVHRNLFKGVNKLNNTADLIISLGGLVSAYATVQEAEKPFLVLLGRKPESTDFALEDNANFCGGVDLHTTQDNQARVQALVGIGVPQNSIWLMYNPNSRMGRSEAAEWRRTGNKAIRAAISVDDDPDGNDPAEFEYALRRLSNKNARGVVISSDPSFSKNRDQLVAQANATFQLNQMKFCYPSEIYGSATPAPLPNSSVTIGPNLLTAYERMGEKAARVAADLEAGRPPAFQGLDDATLLSKPFVY